MPDETPRPARLPGDAPPELRRFVACEASSVELDLERLSWLPKPKGLPEGVDPTPEITIADGATSTSATIGLSWAMGFISISLPASIVDGQLRIDADQIGFGIGDAVSKWVDDFNATLAANDKQLSSFDVDGSKITLTKRDVVASAEPGATGGVAPVTTASPPAETPADADDSSSRSGCLTWLIGAGAAVLAAIGIGVVATRGGDDTETQPPVETTTTITPTTTTAAPPPPSTIAEVGAADPPEAVDDPDPEPELRICGTNPLTEPVPAPFAGELDGYLIIGDRDPCELGLDSYLPDNCDPAVLPCAVQQAPIYAAIGTPGTDHSGSVADAVTGQSGNSTASHDAYVNGFGLFDTAALLLTADCGGNIVNGEATIASGGTAIVEAPLISFGPCTGVSGELRGTRSDGTDFTTPFPAFTGHDWVVDAAEPPPSPPSTDGLTITDDRFVVQTDWAAATNTVNNTLGARFDDPGCTFFFDPQNVDVVVRLLDSCPVNDHAWVFASGLTDVEVELTVTDTITGHTGSYVNPVGEFAPIVDSGAFATSSELFDNTVLPCGPSDVGVTVCPTSTDPVGAGGFVSVSAAMVAPIPIESDGTSRTHIVDFAASGGPAYTIEHGPDGWTIDSSESGTRARAVLRHNSLSLIAPDTELPEGRLTYTWRTTVDGATVEQRPTPVSGVIRTPEVPLAEQAAPEDEADVGDEEGSAEVEASNVTEETVRAFYEQFATSIATGDTTFSLARLHPIVFEVYPDSCPAALASFTDETFAVDVIGVVEPEPWTWELPDGRSFDLDETIPVEVALSGRGQSGAPSTAHLALVDDELRWFTFC